MEETLAYQKKKELGEGEIGWLRPSKTKGLGTQAHRGGPTSIRISLE
jgi:hypothetical protein